MVDVNFSQAHRYSDKDSSAFALHHTLGLKPNQASPGNHKHDGKNSQLLMKNVTVTGSKGGNAALISLIPKLATALGFTDSTT